MEQTDSYSIPKVFRGVPRLEKDFCEKCCHAYTFQPRFQCLRLMPPTPLKADTYLGGALPHQTPPLTASPRPLLANFRFSKNTIFPNVKLWKILFMVFLTHRNLPDTLGSHILKIENVQFWDLFCIVIFLHFCQMFWFAITAIRASPRSKSRPDSKSP